MFVLALRIVSSLLLLFCFFCIPAKAAGPTGAITGLVRDNGGKPLAAVKVQLTGPVTRTTASAADGTFSFGHLPAGTYALFATAGGFESAGLAGLNISAGGTVNANVTLAAATLSSLREIGHVTASRSSINTSPAAIASLSSQDYIDRSQPQVVSLLDELPGVELNRNSSGAPGANAEVAIRGAATYETQNLIDGHPVSAGTYGDYVATFLNALILDDVEVAKGPGALGNTIENAVGGTVNFRTPQIAAHETARFLAGYNSFDGSYYAARYSNTFGKVGVLVGYARYGTPGYETNAIEPYVYNTSGTPNYTYVPIGTVTDSLHLGQTFDNRAELYKLSYTFSPTTALTLGDFSSQTWNDETGTLANFNPVTIAQCVDTSPPSSAPPPYNCTGQDSQPGSPAYTNPKYRNLIGKTINGFYGYNGDFETNNEPMWTADLRSGISTGTALVRYYAGSIQRIVDGIGEAGTIQSCGDPQCIPSNAYVQTPYLQNEHDLLHGLDAEYSLPVGRDTLTAGYDHHSDLTNYCSGDPTGGAALFCSVPGVLEGSSTLSLRATLALNDQASLVLGNYFSNGTYTPHRYDPRVGFTYRVNPQVVVRAALGSTYVAPFAGYINPVAYVNQNTLYPVTKPIEETSSGFNLGSDILVGRFGKLTIDGYATRVFDRLSSNSISVPPAEYNGQPYKYVSFTYNSGNAFEKGLELAFEERPPVGVGFRTSVDLNRAYGYDVNAPNAGSQQGPYSYLAEGVQLPEYPFSKERAEVSYRTRAGQSAVFGMTAYGQWNAFGEPGFSLFDASLSTPFQHGLRLQVAVANAFNHDNGRTFTEYNYGYAPAQATGGLYPQSLFFAQPRTLSVQLQRTFGN